MGFDTFDWSSYHPGYLNQDLLTLPLEGLTIAVLNEEYTPRSHALWPFQNESADSSEKPTTLPASALAPVAVGVVGAVFSGLTLSNSKFPIWLQARGWLHAVLLTEIATSGTKVIFQRKRPFFDTELSKNGFTSADSRFSFISGHSSHAFSFATYSSLMMFEYSPSPVVNWIYSIVAFSGAAAIAYTRVYDHAHHMDDVVAGGIVGTVIAASVFYRVHELEKRINSYEKEDRFSWDVMPMIVSDEKERFWYGGNVEFRY